MYTEGMADLNELISSLIITPPDQKESKMNLIRDRTKNRYLPAFEKVSESAQRLGAPSSKFWRNAMAGFS